MKKHGVILLALVFCHVAQASVQTAIEALGSTNLPPVLNGMVFVGGEYISPPYVVERMGNEMRINGKMIEVLYKWPPPEFKTPPIITTAPSVPLTITKNSTQYDKEVGKYVVDWLHYLRTIHSTNTIQEMIKAYEALPCVVRAYQRDNNHLGVIWSVGGDDNVFYPVSLTIGSRAHRKEFYTPENLIKVGNHSVKMMYERLKIGDYYFLPTPSDRHSRHTGLSAKAQFRVALPLIDGGASAEEISKAVETQTGAPFTVDFCRALLRHKDSLTPEFRRRIYETGK